MTTAISIGWPYLIGKCRSIFLRYSHRSLTGQFGIMESTHVAFVEWTCHFIGNKYQFFIPELCQQVSTLGDNS